MMITFQTVPVGTDRVGGQTRAGKYKGPWSVCWAKNELRERPVPFRSKAAKIENHFVQIRIRAISLTPHCSKLVQKTHYFGLIHQVVLNQLIYVHNQ